MRTVDLSLSIAAGMPVYPGDPEVGVDTALTIDRDGVAVARLDMGSHTGTHLDAPAHSIQGGRTVDEIPLDVLWGEAAILQASVAAGISISCDDIAGGVPPHLPTIVCIATGWDRHFGSSLMEAHPSLSMELVHTLWDRGARVLGVDMLSPDRTSGANSPLMEVHQHWLGSDGVIVENLTGLTTLPGSVEISLLPLKIQAIDGSPVRAVARFTEGSEVA